LTLGEPACTSIVRTAKIDVSRATRNAARERAAMPAPTATGFSAGMAVRAPPRLGFATRPSSPPTAGSLRMKVKSRGRSATSSGRLRLGAGDDELKRRRWGCLPAALLAAQTAERCAPRCRTRTSFGSPALPVGDESAVGELGLTGELALEVVLGAAAPERR